MRANPLPDPWREAAGPRRRAGESGAELAAVRTPAGAPPPESNLAEPLAKEPPDLSTATVTTQAGPEPSDGPHAEQVEQELPRPTRPRKRPPGQRPGAADRHAQPDADGESDRCDQTPKACRADVPAAAEAPLRKSRSASSSSSGSLESSVASLDGTVLAGAPARRDQAAELHRLSGAWSPGAPGSGFGGSPFLSSPLSLPDFALGALTQPAVPPPGSVFARPGFPWHRIGPHEAEMMLKLMGTQRVPTAAFPRACVGASTAARRPPERVPAAADGPIPEGGAVGERQSPCAEGESRATFHFGVARDCGMRQYMEDRHSVVSMFAPHTERRRSTKRGADSSQPSSSFCAVFDGHNGAFAAEKASTRLHDLLASDTALGEWCATREAHVSTAGEVVREGHCPVGSCLERTFLQLDREIIRETRAQNTRDGCTALAILQLGCILWVANAGDCRAVLKRGDFAHRLSNDHKPNIDSEKHRIHVAGGRVEFLGCWRVTHNTLPIALACSRSLGDADFKFPIPLVDATPEVFRIKIGPQDEAVVIGSDGLWDVMDDQEAIDIVSLILRRSQQASAGVYARARGPHGLRNERPHRLRLMEAAAPGAGRSVSEMAKEAAEYLVAHALAKGTEDNVTALVVLLQWEGSSEPVVGGLDVGAPAPSLVT